MSQGQFPFCYLGIPLYSKKHNALECRTLVDKVTARLHCWFAKLLSYAGRVELVKSVICGIQAFWMQIFCLPRKVLKLINMACCEFIWSGGNDNSKSYMVAWDFMCLPKSNGGLNLKLTEIWNRSAILKLLYA